jgi:hypothetical protein
MKSLKHYIAESVHTYDYTIKIAGDVTDNFLELFTYNLTSKFDPKEISKPTYTPIQKSPYGFPDLENQRVCIIKAKFRYPANEPMIQQMAQLLGHNLNMVRVIDTKYDDSVDHESELYANQMKHSPVLTHEEMEDNGKKASKEYAGSYLNSIKDQAKDDKINMPYAAKETKDAFDPFKPYLDDKKLGDQSPMSKITRPAKPPIGTRSRA